MNTGFSNFTLQKGPKISVKGHYRYLQRQSLFSQGERLLPTFQIVHKEILYCNNWILTTINWLKRPTLFPFSTIQETFRFIQPTRSLTNRHHWLERWQSHQKPLGDKAEVSYAKRPIWKRLEITGNLHSGRLSERLSPGPGSWKRVWIGFSFSVIWPQFLVFAVKLANFFNVYCFRRKKR